MRGRDQNVCGQLAPIVSAADGPAQASGGGKPTEIARRMGVAPDYVARYLPEEEEA